MKVSIASMWLMRIGGSYLLARGMGLEILGVWVAIFLDWGLRAALFFIRFQRGAWRAGQILR